VGVVAQEGKYGQSLPLFGWNGEELLLVFC